MSSMTRRWPPGSEQPPALGEHRARASVVGKVVEKAEDEDLGEAGRRAGPTCVASETMNAPLRVRRA